MESASGADSLAEAPLDHQKIHRDILILMTGILVLSLLLPVPVEGQVRVAGFSLPPLCPLKAFSGGLSCPGCGLTRSFIAMAHGAPGQAFGFHRLGPLLFVLTALQLPYRLWALKTERPTLGMRGLLVLPILMLLLILNWLLGFVMG